MNLFSEFFLAWVQSLTGVACGLAIVCAISLAILTIARLQEWDDNEEPLFPGRARYYSRVLFFGFLLFTAFASIPSIEDVWKVRIAFIKLALASPENVVKGADEIGRIAHKLECKYVGCKEDEKKETK